MPVVAMCQPLQAPSRSVAGLREIFAVAVRDVHGMNVLTNMSVQALVLDSHSRNTLLKLSAQTERGIAVLDIEIFSQPFVVVFSLASEVIGEITINETTYESTPVSMNILRGPPDEIVSTEPFLIAVNLVAEWEDPICVEIVHVNESFAARNGATTANLSGLHAWNGSLMMPMHDSRDISARKANVSVDLVGSHVLRFSSPPLPAVISRPFHVRHGAPTTLFATFLGTNFTSMLPLGPVQVAVVDNGGNVVPVDDAIDVSLQYVENFYPPGFNDEFNRSSWHRGVGEFDHRAWNDGRARYSHGPSYVRSDRVVLKGVTKTAAVDGIVSFDSLHVSAARSGYVMKFKMASFAYGEGKGESIAFSIKPGFCHRMSLERIPTYALATAPFSVKPMVTVVDEGNNTIDLNKGYVQVSLLRNGSDNGAQSHIFDKANLRPDRFQLLGIRQMSWAFGLAEFTDLSIIQYNPI